MIDPDEIYDQTDGGLQIFEHLLGADLNRARRSANGTRVTFCIDGEKNPSASLLRARGGLWMLTVFNDDQVPRTAIKYWMHRRGVDFVRATGEIVEEMGLRTSAPDGVLSQPAVACRKAPAGTDPDYYKIDQMDGFTEKGLEVLGGMVVPETCHRYRFFQIRSYTRCEGNNLVTRTATPDYPIFALIFDKWAKIYQPLSQDKGGRFRYCGRKPDHFLFGMDVLEATYEKLNEDADTPVEEGAEQEKRPRGPRKVDHVFIMSGDRDALNMAGAGFPVVWRNSESEPISADAYARLRKHAQQVINVPDIDDEGVRYARALAERYLDMQTLWLPDDVKQRSYRGKPGKDFRDWIGMQDLKVSKYTPEADREAEKNRKRGRVIHAIRDMVKMAYPMQFWEEVCAPQTGKLSYYLSPTYLYNFLYMKGYGILKAEDASNGYQIIHVKDNVVSKVVPADIRQAILVFGAQRCLPAKLRDALTRTKAITGESLFGMTEYHLNFTRGDRRCQWMFFLNAAWKVTPQGIEQYRQIPNGVCAWKDTVSDFRVKLRQDAPFRIEWDEAAGRYDIRIFDKASNYFKILINTSRMHWKAERDSFGEDARAREQYFRDNHFEIAGSRLSQDQIAEQKQHLINKIFAIGYLLHGYKDPARAWAVFAMDNRIGNGRDSNGGSGKSIVLTFLKNFTAWSDQEGRDPNLTDNTHMLQGVTKYTDLVMVDDAKRSLQFDYFFSKITGSMTVNPKGLPPYTIPFRESPKFIFTSNYILHEDPSTARRLLYMVFSDWYHSHVEGDEYQGEYKVYDDFGGRSLFEKETYTEAEWNEDINFLAFCLKFYLQTTTADGAGIPDKQKVNPPLGNIRRRQILSRIDVNFMEWADVYIVERLGMEMMRSEMYADFLSNGGFNYGKTTPHNFKKNLETWAKFHGYALNPGSKAKDGRLQKKLPNGATVEYFVVAPAKMPEEQDLEI